MDVHSFFILYIQSSQKMGFNCWKYSVVGGSWYSSNQRYFLANNHGGRHCGFWQSSDSCWCSGSNLYIAACSFAHTGTHNPNHRRTFSNLARNCKHLNEHHKHPGGFEAMGNHLNNEYCLILIGRV